MSKAEEVEREEKEKKYETDVLYLHKSKAGKHLYIFGGEDQDGKPILGEGVKSLLMNVEDVQGVLGGAKWGKVSVMRSEKKEVRKNGE